MNAKNLKNGISAVEALLANPNVQHTAVLETFAKGASFKNWRAVLATMAKPAVPAKAWLVSVIESDENSDIFHEVKPTLHLTVNAAMSAAEAVAKELCREYTDEACAHHADGFYVSQEKDEMLFCVVHEDLGVYANVHVKEVTCPAAQEVEPDDESLKELPKVLVTVSGGVADVAYDHTKIDLEVYDFDNVGDDGEPLSSDWAAYAEQMGVPYLAPDDAQVEGELVFPSETNRTVLGAQPIDGCMAYLRQEAEKLSQKRGTWVAVRVGDVVQHITGEFKPADMSMPYPVSSIGLFAQIGDYIHTRAKVTFVSYSMWKDPQACKQAAPDEVVLSFVTDAGKEYEVCALDLVNGMFEYDRESGFSEVRFVSNKTGEKVKLLFTDYGNNADPAKPYLFI